MLSGRYINACSCSYRCYSTKVIIINNNNKINFKASRHSGHTRNFERNFLWPSATRPKQKANNVVVNVSAGALSGILINQPCFFSDIGKNNLTTVPKEFGRKIWMYMWHALEGAPCRVFRRPCKHLLNTLLSVMKLKYHSSEVELSGKYRLTNRKL